MIDPGEIETSKLVALPPGGETFLEALYTELDPEYVKSLLFFGSTVTGGVSKSSDIDFIIVLADDSPEAYRSQLTNGVDELSAKHLETDTAAENRLERQVQQLTGVFQSGFVTTESEIRSGEFHSIFNTSGLVYFLAPWRTVLVNVFHSAVVVYGDRIEPNWEEIGDPRTRHGRELAASVLMNSLLAGFQIVYSLISAREPIYSQEAYKWSIYTITSHLLGRPHRSIDEALAVTPSILDFHSKFRDMRDDSDLAFRDQVLFPLIIKLLHLWAGAKLVGKSLGLSSDISD